MLGNLRDMTRDEGPVFQTRGGSGKEHLECSDTALSV